MYFQISIEEIVKHIAINNKKVKKYTVSAKFGKAWIEKYEPKSCVIALFGGEYRVVVKGKGGDEKLGVVSTSGHNPHWVLTFQDIPLGWLGTITSDDDVMEYIVEGCPRGWRAL